MVSNYPPGVTGNEYEIAGPDFEEDADENCSRCGSSMILTGCGSHRWVACVACNYTEEIDDTCPGCNRPDLHGICP